MNKEYQGLITIQKFIYLLNDFYYNEFVEHLAAVNATLPLKLVQVIKRKLPGFDSHEQLCKSIYGAFGKGPKQNFNQLAAYTLRLSGVLAQNYPDYLHHNIFKIQSLVNEGRGGEADFIADMLLEIAGRTDDFQCQIFVLNFLSQQAFIAKNTTVAMKLDAQLMEVISNNKIFTDIQLFTRKILAEVKLEKKEIARSKDYLLGYTNSNSAAIRILCRHSYLLILYQFDLQAFKEPEIGNVVEQLEKDLHNQSHIVFPYLLDLRSSLFFMKLNSTLNDVNSKANEREFEELSEHYKAIKYWKTFVNTGQLYLITIQCTKLYNSYENVIYHPGYPATVTEYDDGLIKDYLDKCRAILKLNMDEGKYEYEIMSYRIVYGALLIISGGRNIKQGLNELEGVLVNYQQSNLNTETDSIFMCLMLGYFSLKDYGQCAKIFKRYSKSIKGKPVFEDNDVRIRAYYYLSQWLVAKSRQYAIKLTSLLQECADNSALKVVETMIAYFNVPS